MLAVVLYWQTARQWIFALVLTTALFVPLYLVNDLLSPFRVLVAYASKGPGFYWWRTLFPITVAALALATPSSGRFALRSLRRESGLIVLGILALVVLIRVALPVGMALNEGNAWNTYVELDAAWLLYFAMLAFVIQPSRGLYWVMLSGGIAGAASAAVHLVLRPWQGPPDFWRLMSFAQEILVTVLLTRLAYQLWRPAVRNCFTLRGQTA